MIRRWLNNGLVRCAVLFCGLSPLAQAAQPHAWLPPFGLARVGQGDAEVQADVALRVTPLVNPVDLGTILPPHGWLLLGPGQKAEATVAAFARSESFPEARVQAWFVSQPKEIGATAFPLVKGERVERPLPLPPLPAGVERDTLKVVLESSPGKELWHKEIPVMFVSTPPALPKFGATRLRLRYDAPISVRNADGSFSSLDYETAWPKELDDVVVSLPGGGRFVFWRGASYVPFWASARNTGLSYEWAETTPPKDGYADCVEPLMDKELRYSRVEIVESTPARVRVRWSYQSCDFQYKVWGDTAVEEFVFYPDGFGTRTLTLKSALDGNYELSEFIILTPQGAYPLEVLPPNLVEILFLDGQRRDLAFPHTADQKEKLRSRSQPAVFRVRMHREEPSTAVYFNPGDLDLPQVAFGPFSDQGQIVTPCYWGSHWPLARGQTTGGAINDRIHASPAHNSVLSWAMQRPRALVDTKVDTVDSLGKAKTMRLQRWSWLIGMTAEKDDAVLDVARSFATPPAARALKNAQVDSEPFVQERRALRFVVQKSPVDVTLVPHGVAVNPVLEFVQPPKKLKSMTLDGVELPADRWAWDGSTLWLNATLREVTRLRLQFGE